MHVKYAAHSLGPFDLIAKPNIAAQSDELLLGPAQHENALISQLKRIDDSIAAFMLGIDIAPLTSETLGKAALAIYLGLSTLILFARADFVNVREVC